MGAAQLLQRVAVTEKIIHVWGPTFAGQVALVGCPFMTLWALLLVMGVGFSWPEVLVFALITVVPGLVLLQQWLRRGKPIALIALNTDGITWGFNGPKGGLSFRDVESVHFDEEVDLCIDFHCKDGSCFVLGAAQVALDRDSVDELILELPRFFSGKIYVRRKLIQGS